MKQAALVGLVMWQGLFVGAEQTAAWRAPLRPGFSASAAALFSVGRIGFRVVYIHPLAGPWDGGLVQIGASVRLF